ncbi:hypothetical protein AB1Y20_011812 [Prymnesium parvum]|uniref:Chromo domain-containing protein n=1 Tax=Prymnesium parvum TaxID=97485 RepID=A0AB34IIH0_PRYPA
MPAFHQPEAALPLLASPSPTAAPSATPSASPPEADDDALSDAEPLTPQLFERLCDEVRRVRERGDDCRYTLHGWTIIYKVRAIAKAHGRRDGDFTVVEPRSGRKFMSFKSLGLYFGVQTTPVKAKPSRAKVNKLLGLPDENGARVVEALVDRRTIEVDQQPRQQYKVRWEGRGAEGDTWEDATTLFDSTLAGQCVQLDASQAASMVGRLEALYLQGQPSFRPCGTFGCTLPDKHPGLHDLPEMGKRVRRPAAPAHTSPAAAHPAGRAAAEETHHATPEESVKEGEEGGDVPLGAQYQVEVPPWSGVQPPSRVREPELLYKRQIEMQLALGTAAALTAAAGRSTDDAMESAAVVLSLRPSRVRDAFTKRYGSATYDLQSINSDESDWDEESSSSLAERELAKPAAASAPPLDHPPLTFAVRLRLRVAAGGVCVALSVHKSKAAAAPKRCGTLGCTLPDKHRGIHQIHTSGPRHRQLAVKAQTSADSRPRGAGRRGGAGASGGILKGRQYRKSQLQPSEGRKAAKGAKDGLASGEEAIYIVERLLERRFVHGAWEYLVRWEGFSSDKDSWEKEENILDDRLIHCFLKGREWTFERPSKRSRA